MNSRSSDTKTGNKFNDEEGKKIYQVKGMKKWQQNSVMK